MSKVFKLMSMKKRTSVVTGAGGNVGKIISHTLYELGSNLILIDNSKNKLKGIEKSLSKLKGGSVISLVCNLENEQERNEILNFIFKNYKKLNCLINNAAFTGDTELSGWNTNFEKQSLETWRRAMEVNLTSAFHLSQSLYKILKKSKGANIINIASIYGELGPDWTIYNSTSISNPAAYSASKGGLIQLTRWLATTLSPEVRVNAISPGGIIRKQPKNFINRYVKKTPLGRMATEEDLIGAISYLASDLSKYVTAQVLRVDGGWSGW